MAPETIHFHALSKKWEGSYAKLRDLKHKFGSWKKAWEKTEIAKPDSSDLLRSGIRLVLFEDKDYPSLLREIPHPPHGIYIKGSLPEAASPWIGIVGTRKATEEGKQLGFEFGKTLGAKTVVVSGLAFGIDRAAHEGCLAAGGKTIAVLGSGLQTVYPRTNAQLAEKIVKEGGALISEYPPEMPPLPFRFLERNRIVSGLVKTLLVIEAPEGSGSLVTARFAEEQNRDVLVVPGPVRHPNYKGSHALIRSGAMLASTPEDVFESLGITSEIAPQMAKLASFEEEAILEALRNAGRPLDTDELIKATKLEPSIMNQALSMLILKSILKEHGAGYGI